MTVRPVLLDAPSNLGLKPKAPGREPGARHLARALRARALLDRLRAEDGGAVEPPPYDPQIERPATVRNATAIAAYSVDLADALEPLLKRRAFPLVLGGDCSILLGPALALRRRGRYGLLFLDGHHDLLTPETSGSKGAAGMDLALAVGRGPALLADLEGRRPLVREEDVVLMGHRDRLELYGWSGAPPGFGWFPLDEVRRRGAGNAARAALERFEEVEGIWIHLDADVLDDAVMPAVDSRQPDGLAYRELDEVIRTVLASGRAVGLHVTVFDPDLDPDGTIAEGLASFLAGVFAGEDPSGTRVR